MWGYPSSQRATVSGIVPQINVVAETSLGRGQCIYQGANSDCGLILVVCPLQLTDWKTLTVQTQP